MPLLMKIWLSFFYIRWTFIVSPAVPNTVQKCILSEAAWRSLNFGDVGGLTFIIIQEFAEAEEDANLSLRWR